MNADGVVIPIADGITEIVVTGTYEGVEQQDTIKVKVKNKNLYIGEEMISATLWIADREAYGEFSCYDSMIYSMAVSYTHLGGWPIEFKDDFYPTNYSEQEVRQGNQVIYSNSGAFSTWGSAISGYTWDYTQDTMRTVAPVSYTHLGLRCQQQHRRRIQL